MTARRLALLAALAPALLLGACSTPATRVVLLPQADGKPSAVVVSSEEGEQTLAQPYQRATAARGARGAPKVDRTDADRIQAENKSLFDMAPPPAQRYTLYFDGANTALTTASQTAMNDALAAALARGNGSEIVVTGHTDTIGASARNDELSRGRAEQVRQLLVARGFPARRIDATGRGERDLLVQTGDETAEPRNRRVTIEVR